MYHVSAHGVDKRMINSSSSSSSSSSSMTAHLENFNSWRQHQLLP